jgi:hypothetical protein
VQRIPLGDTFGAHAVRRRRPRRRELAWPLAATVVGVGAALAGVALARSQPPVAIRLDATGYYIGGQDLVARGGGVYEGHDGAVLVIERRGPALVAGASADLDGEPATGSCLERIGSGTEQCSFTLGPQHLSSRDRWTGNGWLRRYGDGEELAIEVRGSTAAPVPFPLGR